MLKQWLAVCAAVLVLGQAAASAQTPIRPGVDAAGELAPGDRRLQSGEFNDAYTIEAAAGAEITVAMTSDAFDAYVMIRGPGLAQDNDDAPGYGRNARLTVTAPEAGVYQVIATSFQPGERGAYTLRVDVAGGGTAAAAPALPATAPGARLSLDRPATGQLARTDQRFPSGAYVDSFEIEGRAGQRLELTLTSAALDPIVMIDGPGLTAVNDDDMEAGTTNSRLIVTLPEDGVYLVRATSYTPGELGNYQLLVRDAGALPVAAFAAGSTTAPAAALALGEVVQGGLQDGDETLRSGEFTDSYSFSGVVGQRVRITMTSQDLDAYLILISPSGGQEENDDAAAGVTDSRLDAALSEDGVYTIIATSYRPGERGAYAISVSDLSRASGRNPDAVAASGAPGAAPPVTAPAGDAVLTTARPANGSLAAGDSRLRSGEFMDSFTFEGRRGQRATLTLSSNAFDPYLMLTMPDGRQIENDDMGGGSLNSQIIEVLPADGVYEVAVTSYQPGETGAYALSLALEDTGVEVNRQMEGGRVFAVLVGISDYAGTANNLAFTAEDAVKLGETLELRGVLAPGSVVLTEAEATIPRVRQAFQQVAALAGPDDTFLFFFSGHGVQNRGPVSATEPDAYEEAIVLRDGQISDNELAQMFGQVRSRVALLAIDACFAGGFARDVVSRPNVMGLFSSEEDLTSSVAEKFRAGGYLSYFLRNGLAGDGDANGDAVITAGELSAYLRREFASEVTDVEAETTEGQRNYQFLVIDRGGVKIDDMVVALR